MSKTRRYGTMWLNRLGQEIKIILILLRFISMDGELGLKMGSVRTIILGNNMYAGKPNPLDTEVNKIKYFWNLFISYSSLSF